MKVSQIAKSKFIFISERYSIKLSKKSLHAAEIMLKHLGYKREGAYWIGSMDKNKVMIVEVKA